MTRRPFAIAARFLFSLVTLVAIAAQLRVHMRAGFDVVNFFSYFTNLSNLFAAVVMLTGAVQLLQNRTATRAAELVRGSSVAGMAVVGIVFSALLRGEDLGALMPWVNAVVHYVMPVVALLDWLFVPPAVPLPYNRIHYWLVFPLSYLVWVLIRGAVMGWHPYPFLNPGTVGGYRGVVLYSAAISGLFLVVSLALIAIGNRLGTRIA